MSNDTSMRIRFVHKPSPKPKISVIIPTRNCEKTIQKCLSTLFAQTFRDFEVILVDSASEDRTLEIASKFSVTILQSRETEVRRGARAFARNVGASFARGDLFVFTDADCYFPPNWLRTVWSYFQRTDIKILGGSDPPPEDDPLISHAVWLTEFVRKNNTKQDVDACFVIKNSNLACRREVFLSLQGFAEVEELDFCLRASMSKHRVLFDPSILVYHLRRPTIGSVLREVWRTNMRTQVLITQAIMKHRNQSVVVKNNYWLTALFLVGTVALIISAFLNILIQMLSVLFVVVCAIDLAYLVFVVKRLGWKRRGILLLPIVIILLALVRTIAILVSPFVRRSIEGFAVEVEHRYAILRAARRAVCT